MGKPKGKTPSLLTMSTGTPIAHLCGQLTPCNRCGSELKKGTPCFQIPKTKSGFTAKPIFCIDCTSEIINKTKADILTIEKALDQYFAAETLTLPPPG